MHTDTWEYLSTVLSIHQSQCKTLNEFSDAVGHVENVQYLLLEMRVIMYDAQLA